MAEFKSHYAGKLKFIIHNEVFHISDMPQTAAPSHYLIGFLLKIVSKKDALEIYRANEEQKSTHTLVYQLFGQALQGGYAELSSVNPLRYRFLAGAMTVPSSTTEHLAKVQRNGSTIFNLFTYADVKNSDLLK